LHWELDRPAGYTHQQDAGYHSSAGRPGDSIARRFAPIGSQSFKSLPQIQVPVLHSPFVNAFFYGLLYGPITLPCSGAFVVSIFALSLTVGEAISKLWIFLYSGWALAFLY